MHAARMGEILSHLANLSHHDVSEILEDQRQTKRRFGEIALSWGLCQPRHVWQAWWKQLNCAPARVDILALGVDSQALPHLPRHLAFQYQCVPLRCHGEQVVLAVSAEGEHAATRELPVQLGKQLAFVVADPEQISVALTRYYGLA